MPKEQLPIGWILIIIIALFFVGGGMFSIIPQDRELEPYTTVFTVGAYSGLSSQKVGEYVCPSDFNGQVFDYCRLRWTGCIQKGEQRVESYCYSLSGNPACSSITCANFYKPEGWTDSCGTYSYAYTKYFTNWAELWKPATIKPNERIEIIDTSCNIEGKLESARTEIMTQCPDGSYNYRSLCPEVQQPVTTQPPTEQVIEQIFSPEQPGFWIMWWDEILILLLFILGGLFAMSRMR